MFARIFRRRREKAYSPNNNVMPNQSSSESFMSSPFKMYGGMTLAALIAIISAVLLMQRHNRNSQAEYTPDAPVATDVVAKGTDAESVNPASDEYLKDSKESQVDPQISNNPLNVEKRQDTAEEIAIKNNLKNLKSTVDRLNCFIESDQQCGEAVRPVAWQSTAFFSYDDLSNRAAVKQINIRTFTENYSAYTLAVRRLASQPSCKNIARSVMDKDQSCKQSPIAKKEDQDTKTTADQTYRPDQHTQDFVIAAKTSAGVN